MNKTAGIGGAIVAVVVFLMVVTGTWYTVDAGEKGVVLTNGAYSETVGQGLHGKLPIVQWVVTMSTRQQAVRWDCRAGDRCPDGHAQIMEAYSRDQQPADMTVSVIYHVPESEVANVYTNYGTIATLADRTIWRKAPQEIKTVFGQFTAEGVIQNRAVFNQQVLDAVARAVDGPVVIDSVQVENIVFSPAYIQAVEQRMTAQVDVAKQEQRLAQEKILADIAVTQATGRANSVKAEADATAYRVRAEGEASAAAIKSRAAALADNPLLVEQTKAERWNGILPTTVLPNGTVPFLEVTKK